MNKVKTAPSYRCKNIVQGEENTKLTLAPNLNECTWNLVTTTSLTSSKKCNSFSLYFMLYTKI
jgi:hypothetical protein